ncbi:TPA: SEC10/PgrA surface exclusion domain-containing protein, partial [Streptococcus suis]|nr:SEC10/PgrA surface exclusion domain-containing protein [Streptococcus suis]
MRKSIKATSLVAGVILAGVASPALAEEVTATVPVATPVVSGQNQNITQEVVDSAKIAAETSSSNVEKQQATVDTAKQAVTEATAEVENASEALATANAAIAIPESIKASEETDNKAQGELEVAQTEQTTADGAVASAQEAVTNQEKEVSTAITELTNAETALVTANTDVKNVENAVQSQEPTIMLSEEYKYALKQLEDYRYAGVEDSRSNNPTNKIDINSADHKKAYDLLKTISESLFKTNTYQGSSDEEQVDLSNMTGEQRRKVNAFALSLINNIRDQFGKAPLVTTKGLFDFANEVANNNSKRYINSDTAEYKVHNDAAQKFGLSTFDEEWTTRSKQNLFVAAPTNLLPEKEKFKRQYTQGETTIDAPVLTMGELKENIYNAFKMQLFNTDNVGGVVRVKDFSVRSWEQAMLLSGGAYSERASQFALSINAPLHSYPSDLDPGVYTKYYGIKVNTFVINDPVEDPWKVNTVVDQSKFDTTPLEVKSEEPKSEEPKTEEPKSEEPKTEEPKSEEPKSEEPKSEEPKTEEPKSEEPKTEEPKTEEPKSEEPKTEEPKSEEPKTEESKSEEPKTEEPK